VLSRLGLALSKKQIPQVVENLESRGKSKEALERTVMRPRQVRYQAALRPDCIHSTSLPKHANRIKTPVRGINGIHSRITPTSTPVLPIALRSSTIEVWFVCRV
jgi:hypothetical protein